MYRIAFATSIDYARLIQSERDFARFAIKYGISVEPAVWSSVDTDWSSFDAVVIRSCWDYYLRSEEFLQWLNMLDNNDVTLLNPSSRIRWNMNKFYLRDISEAGYPVVPTLWLEKGNDADIMTLLEETCWEATVIKPALSAGGHETYLVHIDDIPKAVSIIRKLLSGGNVLVQKYIDEINKTGEWSLVFFNGKYSHSVLKKPAAGDFRVQVHHGGITLSAAPPHSVLMAARKIIDHAGKELLYARVDGVLTSTGFQLMELELIEPELFLDTAPPGFKNFAEALIERLESY